VNASNASKAKDIRQSIDLRGLGKRQKGLYAVSDQEDQKYEKYKEDRKKIIDEIIKYRKSPPKTRRALLLHGVWGSGKTRFIKEDLINRHESFDLCKRLGWAFISALVLGLCLWCFPLALETILSGFAWAFSLSDSFAFVKTGYCRILIFLMVLVFFWVWGLPPNFIYVSMYGARTPEDLRQRLNQASTVMGILHFLHKNHKFDTGALLLTIGIFIGIIQQSGDLEGLKILSPLIFWGGFHGFRICFESSLARSSLIILDDLERFSGQCSMDPNELFGFINHEMEHKGYKFLLVCDEEKLKKHFEAVMKGKGLVEEYELLREKVVENRYNLPVHFDVVYKHILEEMKISSQYSENFLAFLEEDDAKKIIENIFYEYSGYAHGLRGYNLHEMHKAAIHYEEKTKKDHDHLRCYQQWVGQVYREDMNTPNFRVLACAIKSFKDLYKHIDEHIKNNNLSITPQEKNTRKNTILKGFYLDLCYMEIYGYAEEEYKDVLYGLRILKYMGLCPYHFAAYFSRSLNLKDEEPFNFIGPFSNEKYIKIVSDKHNYYKYKENWTPSSEPFMERGAIVNLLFDRYEREPYHHFWNFMFYSKKKVTGFRQGHFYAIYQERIMDAKSFLRDTNIDDALQHLFPKPKNNLSEYFPREVAELVLETSKNIEKIFLFPKHKVDKDFLDRTVNTPEYWRHLSKITRNNSDQDIAQYFENIGFSDKSVAKSFLGRVGRLFYVMDAENQVTLKGLYFVIKILTPKEALEVCQESAKDGDIFNLCSFSCSDQEKLIRLVIDDHLSENQNKMNNLNNLYTWIVEFILGIAKKYQEHHDVDSFKTAIHSVKYLFFDGCIKSAGILRGRFTDEKDFVPIPKERKLDTEKFFRHQHDNLLKEIRKIFPEYQDDVAVGIDIDVIEFN
jgi:hypothetical protein